jgi:hypothetical protein
VAKGTTPAIHSFFADVLRALKVPVTAANISWLEGQAVTEGTSAKNNPLATTKILPNVPSSTLAGNSAGVQEYATRAGGVQATADTIAGYPAIVAHLKSGSILLDSFSNPADLVQAYTVWSGNTKDPAKGLSYFQTIKRIAQGNPEGRLSAYSGIGIGNFPIGTTTPGDAAGAAAKAAEHAAGDLATGWVKSLEEWAGPAALRGLLYVTFTVLAIGMVFIALRRTDTAGNVRAARSFDVPDTFKRPPVGIPF